MAIGLGRMLGFNFPENFNYPYYAKSIQDFWRRWHISLSTWLRDYLYFPLGGSRGSSFRTYFNLILVFLLCGLWHGASWMFVIWGLYHGIFLILERLGLANWFERQMLLLRHGYVLLTVIGSWVLFRSETITQSLAFYTALLGFSPSGITPFNVDMYLTRDVMLALVAGMTFSWPVVPCFTEW